MILRCFLPGSANGTGVPWQDDPTARHFASQWLQSPHVNPASWLGQNPYAMNSTMPTSGAIEPSNLPYTVPAGFKLAQDPITGQIFLLPATNLGRCFFKWNIQMLYHIIASLGSNKLNMYVFSMEETYM